MSHKLNFDVVIKKIDEYIHVLSNYVSALFVLHSELIVEHAFDPYSSRPDHRLDSNASFVVPRDGR